MLSTCLLFCRFHLSLLIRQRPRTVALLAAFVLLLIGSGVVLLAQWQRVRVAQERVAGLRAHVVTDQVKRDDVVDSLAPLDLPSFQSSAAIAKFSELAVASGLILNEVSYVLEENNSQPYLRYRFTLTVVSTYPQVRSLVEQLHHDVPHFTMDSIRCRRSDIAVVELSCDLVLSGFFQKDLRG
ncbi:hypothetical protein RBA41_08320 [Massilia sp. CCM 9210]|uniref:hypothetical protein n=1 Tax=Massilia scottii TaxID=3057166 RepID=UPI0027964854|nr:hypothetical protein [Massilia sp. CCM 9210]MDQ1813306.1 hypothetical protein [Massilia sp. CCM 9210]